MEWLRRHAWQLLFGMTALIALIGLNPVKEGIREDPSIPLAFTGMTPDQLQSNNAQTFRLVDVQARFSGIDLIVIGILFSTVLPRASGETNGGPGGRCGCCRSGAPPSQRPFFGRASSKVRRHPAHCSRARSLRPCRRRCS